MTNQCRSTSAGGSAKNGGSLRYLDLSFEGRQQASSGVLNNGFRPHGGYRALRNQQNVQGLKKYPPSPYSYNKPQEYHQQLQNDLDKFFEGEERTSSPTWAIDVSKESNNSGESPLFVKRLLAPGRGPASQSTPSRRLSSSSRDNSMYYRPNRTHQYLTATELKNCSQAEVDVKLGRPTRTTLLRARQRCNSAPVNAYEHRRALQKKVEEREELRRSYTSLTMKDLLGLTLPEGESLHSFLTGARYNRAHYLDAKSLSELGVYMPRGNPLGCFVVKNKGSKEQFDEEPPDSPTSAELESIYSEEGSLSPCPPHPSPPGSPVPQAAPPGRPSTVEPVIHEEVEQETAAMEPEGFQPMEQIFNLEDGLNVKGVGLNKGRAKSARPLSSAKKPPVYADPGLSGNPKGGLPLVQIQGMSINKSPRPREAVPETSGPTPMPVTPVPTPQPSPQPPPPAPVATPVGTPVVTPVALLVPVPSPVRLSQDVTNVTKEDVTKSKEDATKSKEDIAIPVAEAKSSVPLVPVPKVVKLDKSVNMPSIDGDGSHRDDVILTPRVVRLQASQASSTANQKAEASSTANQKAATMSTVNQGAVTSSTANREAVTSSTANQEAVTSSTANCEAVTSSTANQEAVTSSTANQEPVTSSAANEKPEMTPPSANQNEDEVKPANQQKVDSGTNLEQEKSDDAVHSKSRKGKVRFADETLEEDNPNATAEQTQSKPDAASFFFITEDSEDGTAAVDGAGDNLHTVNAIQAKNVDSAENSIPMPNGHDTVDPSHTKSNEKESVEPLANDEDEENESLQSERGNTDIISVDIAVKQTVSEKEDKEQQHGDLKN